jgi:Cu(I)/Ag(I) efflux system membrane fusion protein
MKKIIITLIALLISGNLFAHSDAFKPEFVQSLVQPYLSIQAALASDDLAQAKTGAAAFAEAMKGAPKDEDEKEDVDAFNTPANQIASAESIADARQAFIELSSEMTSLVSHVGISGKENLYAVKCPMANDHKGATWIQSDKTIHNPYFGSKMPKCGSVTKQIAGEKEEKKEGHSGHNH